jgi:hypothetical protein
MGFKIEKIYLDCIDDQGNCFIIYWAKLKIFLFQFYYSGLLFSDSSGLTIEKSAFGESPRPSTVATIEAENELLNVRYSLRRTDDPIYADLYTDQKRNNLSWNCHHPRGFASIYYNGITYNGFGYSETLISQINPVNLPVDELRWGRFLSDSYTIVWINWKDKLPLNKLFFNGIEYNDAIFTDDTISFGDGNYSLMFKGADSIRNGKLSDLLSKMKLLRIFFSKRVLNTVEKKFKASSELYLNAEFLARGWSLYETVTWGK